MSITGRSLAPALLLFSWMAFASQSFADSGIDLRNSEGTFSGTDGDFASSGSIRRGVEGFGILTPARATGGRSFAADGYGLNGIPHGMLFFGTFSGQLTGMVRGTMNEKTADGMDSKLTIGTGREYFNGSPRVDGDDNVRSSSVPEPSTLALLGIGSFILAGELRRKGRVTG
jgi:hypothetical protein